MHVFVDGTPANADCSTDVWQNRQSRPFPPTCRSWLNWMGCSRVTCACVTHDDRLILSNRPRSAATAKIAPKILTFEIVLVLRWKICTRPRPLAGTPVHKTVPLRERAP